MIKKIAIHFAVLIFFSAGVELLGLDKAIADMIYKMEGGQWTLKDAWITSVFVHQYGKYFSISIALTILLFLVCSYWVMALANWRITFRYLLTASVGGTLVVSVGKTFTHVSCPWDFSRYGGSLEYISLIEQLWVRNGSQCFPAGHASAGFAWVSLYFVGIHLRASWRWWGLIAVMLLGLLFGISQQLRGAHFISHDLWSFGTCWMVSLICYHLMLKPYELNQ